jgi:predicted P-loop ATPase
MIPQEMLDEKRWILWTSVEKKDKPGEFSKKPVNPHDKKPFKRKSGWQTDPACWATYDEVCAIVAASPEFGKAFMLGDGFAGVDFDDVLDLTTNALAPWVQMFVRRFDTYTEVSPSGTGLKLFCHGTITDFVKALPKTAGIEVYDRQRMFCVTGKTWQGMPNLLVGHDTAVTELYHSLRKGDVLELFKLRLMLHGQPPKDGNVNVSCPWEAEHSTASAATSTVLYLTDGEATGFKCLHAHCANRNIGHVREWLNVERWNDSVIPDRTENRKPVGNSQSNIRGALKKLEVELSFNEFTDQRCIKWADYNGPLTDAVADDLWLKLDTEFQLRPSMDFYTTVLGGLTREKRFHPVRDYLTALKWDGERRLDTWLSTYAGAENTLLNRMWGSLFMRAAVLRVIDPGCKFDEIPVFISPQGDGKSTMLVKLCLDESWFTDSLPIGAEPKEVIEGTSGIWIAEIADLHGLNKRHQDDVKVFLSRQKDGPVRLAYGRHPVTRLRHFVSAATANTRLFLKDKTGNRRFWPIEVTRINLEGIARDRDQLWAEAYARRGESIRLDPSLYKAAATRQLEHLRDDPWMATLESLRDKDRVRVTEPWKLLHIGEAAQDEDKADRVNAIMQSFGFVKRKARPEKGEKPFMCWVKPSAGTLFDVP